MKIKEVVFRDLGYPFLSKIREWNKRWYTMDRRKRSDFGLLEL